MAEMQESRKAAERPGHTQWWGSRFSWSKGLRSLHSCSNLCSDGCGSWARTSVPTHLLRSRSSTDLPRLRSTPSLESGVVFTAHNPPRRSGGALSERARPPPPDLSKVRQRVSPGLLGNAVRTPGKNHCLTRPRDYANHNLCARSS